MRLLQTLLNYKCHNDRKHGVSIPVHRCTLKSGGHTVSTQQTVNGSLCDLTMHGISCWLTVTCSKQGVWCVSKDENGGLQASPPGSCSGFWHNCPHWGSTYKSQTSGNFCDMRKAALILPEELVSFCTFELQTEETEGNLCNMQLWDYFRMPK